MIRQLACMSMLILAAGAAQPASATPSLSEAGGSYAFSNSGSEIRFAIGQIDGGGLQGHFNRFSGTIRIDPQDIAHSKVNITIVPGSVATGEGRVDAFLKSNAVFNSDVEKAIVFNSASVQRNGPDGAVVKGRLTARGKSASETFNVALENFSKGSVTFHVTGKVFRSRYGMDVGTPIFSNVVDFDMRFVAQRK